MTSSDDGGYVHDPSTFDADGSVSDTDDGSGGRRPRDGEQADWVADPSHPESADREFDWRGWVLVGVIVFAFIVSPLAIVLWPPDFNYLFALLILPLAPAVLLALTAVWATTRP